MQGMLARATKNKAAAKIENIDFIHGRITAIPLASNLADVVISNCVINLVPERDKPLVFYEMHRVLKPGGRVAVFDILARKTMSVEIKRNLELYVGCIAGASLAEDYERYLSQAGFEGQ
jgi:arsenite methyltransferase